MIHTTMSMFVILTKINKYDVVYDTSPKYVLINFSKTNTNCGLDNDRKDNVTTQILRNTFLQKIAFTRTNQNQAYKLAYL